MALSYNRMWKLLIDKKMSKADLRKTADISPNTMTKLRRDEAVNIAILGKVCQVLNCDFGDIMEYIREPEGATGIEKTSIYFLPRQYAVSFYLYN